MHRTGRVCQHCHPIGHLPLWWRRERPRVLCTPRCLCNLQRAGILGYDGCSVRTGELGTDSAEGHRVGSQPRFPVLQRQPGGHSQRRVAVGIPCARRGLLRLIQAHPKLNDLPLSQPRQRMSGTGAARGSQPSQNAPALTAAAGATWPARRRTACPWRRASLPVHTAPGPDHSRRDNPLQRLAQPAIRLRLQQSQANSHLHSAYLSETPNCGEASNGRPDSKVFQQSARGPTT